MAKPTPKLKPKKVPRNKIQAEVFPGNSQTYKKKKPLTDEARALGQQIKGTPGAKKIEFDYQKLEDLAAIGLTNSQIAECLLVSPSTISHRSAEDPKFAQAIGKGRARMMDDIASNLFRLAKKRDKTALIFLSKVHLKWSEWQQPIMQMTPEQLAAAVRGELGKVDGSNDLNNPHPGEDD